MKCSLTKDERRQLLETLKQYANRHGIAATITNTSLVTRGSNEPDCDSQRFIRLLGLKPDENSRLSSKELSFRQIYSSSGNFSFHLMEGTGKQYFSVLKYLLAGNLARVSDIKKFVVLVPEASADEFFKKFDGINPKRLVDSDGILEVKFRGMALVILKRPTGYSIFIGTDES